MKGMPVIASITSAELSKRDPFKVHKIAADIITLTDGHATMEIETADFTRCVNLSYCITIHAVQGKAFDHPYSMNKFEKFDARLQYVAIFISINCIIDMTDIIDT